MIMDNTYRRNEKTGCIVKRQRIEVKCDECGSVWDTLYSNYKRRKYDQDYCKSCRSRKNYHKYDFDLNKFRWSEEERKGSQITKKCLHCGTDFKFHKSSQPKFCGQKCKDNYGYKQKYEHLNNSFMDHPNEVSYLAGVILGDGFSRKVDNKKASQILVACDTRQPRLTDVVISVLKLLEVSYYIEKGGSNCELIYFMLPDDLLIEYGMFFSSPKFNSQPYPVDDVVQNINFAVGLINTDGHYHRRHKILSFCNTVESIVNAFCKCLQHSSILFRKYKYTHLRNPTWKDRYTVNIGRQKETNKLLAKSDFYMKGML